MVVLGKKEGEQEGEHEKRRWQGIAVNAVAIRISAFLISFIWHLYLTSSYFLFILNSQRLHPGALSSFVSEKSQTSQTQFQDF